MSFAHMNHDVVSAGFVPPEAAHWMIYVVLNYKTCAFMPNLTQRDDGIGGIGLCQLQLPDLKKICVALKQIPSTHHAGILKGFQSARKANIIQRIRHCLYQDYPLCTKPSDTVFRLCSEPMTTMMIPSPPVGTFPVTAAAAAAAVDSSSRFMQGQPPYAAAGFGHPTPHSATQSHALFGVPPSAHAAAAATTTTALTNAPRLFQNASSSFDADVAARLLAAPLGLGSGWSSMPQSQLPRAVANNNNDHNHWFSPHRSLAPSVGYTVPNGVSFFQPNTTTPASVPIPTTYIKREGACQAPDSVPNSPAERTMLGQLQQMSFDNPREILTSFRKIEQSEGRPPHIDEVMIDIVMQREAVDEALQMDEARLLSEQTRKTEAAARRQQIQLELQTCMETCTVDVWHTHQQMFPHSWLLAKKNQVPLMLKRHVTVAKTELKQSVIALLKLERDARKWYRDMPRSYFDDVALRLMGKDPRCNPYLHFSTRLRNEIDRLTQVMYTMSEQVGGVPKAFRDAHDAAAAVALNTGSSSNGQRVQPTTMTGLDDDVILISFSPSKEQSTTALANSSPMISQDASVVTTEMIDLCDDNSTNECGFGG